MVIGNLTRIEESAIHGEQNGKGGRPRGRGGDLAAGGKAKVPIGLPQTCWCGLVSEISVRGEKGNSTQSNADFLYSSRGSSNPWENQSK